MLRRGERRGERRCERAGERAGEWAGERDGDGPAPGRAWGEPGEPTRARAVILCEALSDRSDFSAASASAKRCSGLMEPRSRLPDRRACAASVVVVGGETGRAGEDAAADIFSRRTRSSSTSIVAVEESEPVSSALSRSKSKFSATSNPVRSCSKFMMLLGSRWSGWLPASTQGTPELASKKLKSTRDGRLMMSRPDN